jgi:high-affinity iron transporter
MVIFSIQLVIYAFHEYTESIEIANLGIIDSAYWHAATEAYGPQGHIGAWISYSLVLVPVAFLIYGFIKNHQPAKIQASNN